MGVSKSNCGEPCPQSDEPQELEPTRQSAACSSSVKCGSAFITHWRKCHRHVFGGSVGNFLTSGEVAVSLTPSDGQLTFKKRILTDNVRAWTDKRYCYQKVPPEMKGAVLFAGPMQIVFDGMMSLESPKARGFVYIWCEDGLRDGCIPEMDWEEIGIMYWKWGRGIYEKHIPLHVYRKRLASGFALDIPVGSVWVGGIAFKQMPDIADTWVPPPFVTLSGESISWDQRGIDCVADIRERIAMAIAMPPQHIVLLLPSGCMLQDSDPLPTHNCDVISVIINQERHPSTEDFIKEHVIGAHHDVDFDMYEG